MIEIANTGEPNENRNWYFDKGWYTPTIYESNGGKGHQCAIQLYGKRLYFRDKNPLSKSKCAFTIKLEELERALKQAKENPSALFDIMILEIDQDDTGTLATELEVDEDCDDEDEEPPMVGRLGKFNPKCYTCRYNDGIVSHKKDKDEKVKCGKVNDAQLFVINRVNCPNYERWEANE